MNTELRDALNDFRDGAGNIKVTKIPGVPVTGIPLAGMIPVATSGTAATWASPTAPSSGMPVNTFTTKGDLVAAASAAMPVRVGVGADGQILIADSTAPAGVSWGSQGFNSTFTFQGVLTVATGKSRIYNDSGRMLTITATRASANTAPTGATVIVSIKKNGVGIFAVTPANRPTIAIGANTGSGGTPDTTAWAPGEYLMVDILQIGSTVAGADLTVQVYAK